MNRRVWIGTALAIAALVPVVLLSTNRNDSRVELATSPALAAETKSKASATQGTTAKTVKPTLPKGTSAEDVYQKLTAEIEAEAKTSGTGTPEQQMRMFDQIAAKLELFRSTYPKTPEALDATFQLGAMKSGMQQWSQAETYLEEFLAGADTKDREKLAYAHYYLAEAYKHSGKYDKTEGEYKIILRDFSNVNQRLTSYVQTSLAGLDAERKLAIGGEPIHFDVKSISGQKLSPAAYKGKVLLIDFWATWCGPCVAEMPNVKSVYAKYHGQGFEIVGISLDQSRDKLDLYLEKQDIKWPQYFDGKYWNNDIAVSYGVKSIPATFLVDKKGKIRYKSLRGKQLETAVAQLLAEKV